MHRSAARNDALIAMYRDGASLKECGARFGVSMQRAHQILDAAAEPRRRKGHPSKPERDAQVRGWRNAGYTLGQIAAAFEISKPRVWQIIHGRQGR